MVLWARHGRVVLFFGPVVVDLRVWHLWLGVDPGFDMRSEAMRSRTGIGSGSHSCGGVGGATVSIHVAAPTSPSLCVCSRCCVPSVCGWC